MFCLIASWIGLRELIRGIIKPIINELTTASEFGVVEILNPSKFSNANMLFFLKYIYYL